LETKTAVVGNFAGAGERLAHEGGDKQALLEGVLLETYWKDGGLLERAWAFSCVFLASA